jgi:predicted nucleic acid-binding protein
MGLGAGRIAVVDTNVIVAGLLTRDAASPVARVLDGMLTAAFPYALSNALLAEYAATLARPAIARLHGLTNAETELLLTDLAHKAIMLEPSPGRRSADWGDQPWCDLIETRPELALVTPDQPLPKYGAMVGPELFAQAISNR